MKKPMKKIIICCLILSLLIITSNAKSDSNKLIELKEVNFCGNDIIESGEICDGNDENYECSVDCNLKLKSPLGTSSCWKNSLITVFNENGEIIPEAKITLYGFEENLNNEEKIYFPYDKYPEQDLILEGKTDENGQFLIKPEWLVNQYFTIVASKENYLSKFILNRACFMINDYSMTLKSLADYNKDVSEETRNKFLPAKVELPIDSLFSRYEVAGRPIIFSYVPTVREDILKKVKQVNVMLNVVRKPFISPSSLPTGIPSNVDEDLSFSYRQMSEDVKLGQLNTFEFTLPEAGEYYLFFNIVVEKKGNSFEKYYYFPTHEGYNNPPLIKELMEAEGFSLAESSKYSFHSTIIVYPELFNKNDFVELLPRQNANNDERVNIVFLNSGFDQELFKNMAKFVVTESKTGFANIEPFFSNINKFNFWYNNEVLTSDEAVWEKGNFLAINFGHENLTKSQEIYLSHEFGGKTIFVLLKNRNSLIVPTVAKTASCNFNRGISIEISKEQFEECLAENTENECFNNFDLSRIFNHEIGHDLGILSEEYIYNSNANQLFNVEEYSQKKRASYNPNIKPNTYFPVSLDPAKYCYQTTYASGYQTPYNYFVGSIICSNNIFKLSCQNVPWIDLVGNGCGKEGIIDCNKNDSDYFREVGCNFGGGMSGNEGYPNLIKPTFISIMSSKMFFNNIDDYNGRVFGLVNERALCRAIDTYTNSVSGVCEELCLKGCTKGKKCIKGKCHNIPAKSNNFIY
jgi:hypothetical protein